MLATRLAAETLRLLPRSRLSRALGRVAQAPAPRALLDRAIDLYVRAYDVDLSECEAPVGGYRSFDEFFGRALRKGARPIEGDRATAVCPADGRIEDVGAIDARSRLLVKGHEYGVGELLGEERDAAAFEGGTFAVVYLSPRDYHRVHAPVDGEVELVRHVPGTLYPVNRIGTEHVPRLFARNERVAVVQSSTDLGRVATILVGALGVGSVSLAFEPRVRSNSGVYGGTLRYEKGRPFLERGAELGAFHLGSTAIVLVPAPPAGATDELCVCAGDPARVGQRLLRRAGGRREKRPA